MYSKLESLTEKASADFYYLYYCRFGDPLQISASAVNAYYIYDIQVISHTCIIKLIIRTIISRFVWQDELNIVTNRSQLLAKLNNIPLQTSKHQAVSSGGYRKTGTEAVSLYKQQAFNHST